METHRPYSEALRAAVDILGGEKLAKRLGVERSQLHAWVEGRATPPLGAFLDALDVIAAGPYSRGRQRTRVAILPDSPPPTN